jgi:hypothetical protein
LNPRFDPAGTGRMQGSVREQLRPPSKHCLKIEQLRLMLVEIFS